MKENDDTIRLLVLAFNSTYKFLPKPNNPECPDDSAGYEIRSVSFSDSLADFAFITSASKYDAKAMFYLGSQSYTLPFSQLSAPDSGSFDSISFAGRTFMNVWSLRAGNGDSLYYTTANGLVRFRSVGREFTLVKP